ncbi:hypothetical protein MVLG_00316 [Microbotryum lychnidis-dioicae p1A1 Lamole]|uniref:Uncharacterized protein n=1 Tax=Microbotryum lychnidis-dioicae (strain p1A1 Lamole / MvSl-1064) TaxID=683840 RepID=U5GYQ2_USTV1|nr:hypothetical protein MVLG_00316 [Microbotryum lychnidis-dioicae p1A1 Lamole]|eukprot:KDE09411.1 hypothetical protein MVLG_00316 [Microbotryum lychnidis-dioicae p1A1 Lamole]
MFAFMSTFITIAASVALAQDKHDQGYFAPISKGGDDASMSPIAKPGQWSNYGTSHHRSTYLPRPAIVVPVAALVARFGRDTPGWIKYHRRLQGFWTVPATIAIAILGLTAAGINGSIFKAGDIHQIRLGMNENGYHSCLLDVLNIVFVGGFLLVYAYGLAALVVERNAAGRSWFDSIFGLGRAAASRPPQI